MYGERIQCMTVCLLLLQHMGSHMLFLEDLFPVLVGGCCGSKELMVVEDSPCITVQHIASLY